MSGKPKNKWFRGDGTPKRGETIDKCVVFYRREAGQPVFVSHDDSDWLDCWEYAIVPLDDLRLDIEEPEPELVQVKGCQKPAIVVALPGEWFAQSRKGDVRMVFAYHPDKHVAAAAHNAAAEVLNKHGGV